MNNRHYQNQALFFNSEFSKNSKYRLSAWNSSYIRRIKNYMLKDNFKGKSLLDIGAGGAYVTIEMAKIGLNVIALDLSEVAINNIEKYKSRFKLQNVVPIKSNAIELPFKDNYVDYIIANAVLEHIPDETKAIHEWKRILKSGGRMMVVVPLKFRYVWPPLWPINYIRDKQIGHLRRYDLKDLKNKFKMKVIARFYTGHLIKTLWVIYSVLFNSHVLDEKIEIIDEKGKNKQYGASNIVVIFEK